jgi:hypothetical protein
VNAAHGIDPARSVRKRHRTGRKLLGWMAPHRDCFRDALIPDGTNVGPERLGSVPLRNRSCALAARGVIDAAIHHQGPTGCYCDLSSPPLERIRRRLCQLLDVLLRAVGLSNIFSCLKSRLITNLIGQECGPDLPLSIVLPPMKYGLTLV